MTQSRVTQVGIEAVTEPVPPSRVTQLGVESVTAPVPPSRITALGIEAITNPVPPSRITQLGIEALVSDKPLSRITQMGIEVLVPNALPVDLGGTTGQLWPRGGGAVPGGATDATHLRGRLIDTAAPADGNGLIWDAALAKWKAASPAANATSIRGIGVAVTAPTNGQVLKYNSSSGLYEPSTAVVGQVALYNHLAKPLVAGAIDEEFDIAGTLGAGWTAVNVGTSTYDIATSKIKGLTIRPQNTAGWRAYRRELPVGTTDFQWTASYDASLFDGQYLLGGIFVGDGAAGATSFNAYIHYSGRNSNWKVLTERYSPFPSSFNSAPLDWSFVMGAPKMVLRIRRVSTTVNFEWSRDGQEPWGSAAITSFPFTPTCVGVVFYNNLVGPEYGMTFDYTRFLANGLRASVPGRVLTYALAA